MSEEHDETEANEAEGKDERDETPSRPSSRRLIQGAVLLAVVLAFGLGRCTGGSDPASTDPHAGHEHAAEPEMWTCSMHPQVQSPDEDAKCPICGMDLISASEAAGAKVGPGEVALSAREGARADPHGGRDDLDARERAA